jgi:phosphoadenosine phosphosulfate reductase
MCCSKRVGLVHIFGDTTLEFPSTIEYAHRFRDSHPEAIFQIAKNDEQDFYDVCDDIGPPARMMRWCCSMFKTGPITRIINSLYRSQQILTFYGIALQKLLQRDPAF